MTNLPTYSSVMYIQPETIALPSMIITPSQSSIIHSLVETLYLLHLIITTHEDTRPVMNILRHNFHHSVHLAVKCLATSYSDINDHTHVKRSGNSPFSKTIAIGAHSYKILSFPFGLFLSAGYAKTPPYSSVL